MSTFLQLCKDTCREAGIPGGEDAISTVTGNTNDEIIRVVNYVINAWREIQQSHPDWRWMRSTFTLNTTADDGTYEYTDCTDVEDSATISRFGGWRFNDPIDPPKIYLNSTGVSGEGWMTYTDWEEFKSVYALGTQNSGYPQWISVDPQDRIRVGPAPDDVYVITGDYQKSVQSLSVDADTPDMPSEFHYLISYWATRKIGAYDSANELILGPEEFSNPIWANLRLRQLPQPRLGEPLA